MNTLGCFLFFLLGVVLAIGLSLLNIVRILFGMPPKTHWSAWNMGQHQHRPNNNDTTNQKPNSNRSQTKNAATKPKVFDDGEGEYVDFEEIK